MLKNIIPAIYLALLIAYCILRTAYCSAQQYNFKNFTVENGLAQSQVNAMYEDSRGYIWFATEGGVSRYDGVSFKNFTTDDGLANNFVYAIVEDSKGRMWFGTDAGVSIFDGKVFKNITTENGLVDNTALALLDDKTGNIWIGTSAGVSVLTTNQTTFPKDSFKITNYTKNEGLSNSYVNTIVQDLNQNIWFGTWGGGIDLLLADYYQNEAANPDFIHFTQQQGLSNNFVRAVLPDKKGNIWVSSWRGGISYLPEESNNFFKNRNIDSLKGMLSESVFKESIPSFLPFPLQDALSTNRVWDIFEDKIGNIWFGHDGFGVEKYDPQTGTIFRYHGGHGLCNNHIISIMEDREGNLWFGGYSGGVSMFSGKIFTYLNIKSAVSIHEDKYGQMWFGSWGGGVFNFDGNNFTQYSWDQGIGESVVHAIVDDNNGDIWIGTLGGGINKLIEKDITTPGNKFLLYKRKNSCADGAKNCIELDGLTSDHIFSMLVDSRGNLWVGTEGGGAVKFLYLNPEYSISNKPGSFINYNTQTGIIGNTVNTIYEDSKGRIWLGTSEGVSLLNKASDDISNEKFTHFIKKKHVKNFKKNLPNLKGRFLEGLSDHRVISIIEDNYQNSWFGTYGGGISILHPDNSWSYITTKDGLTNAAVVSLINDDEGNIWAGTNNGINKIIPDINNGSYKIKQYSILDGFRGVECNNNAVYRDSEGNLWFGTVNDINKYSPKEDKPNMVEARTYITGIKLFFEEINSEKWRSHYQIDSFSPWFALPLNLKLSYDQNHLTFDFVGISLKIPEKVRYQWILVGFDKEWSPITKKHEVTYSNIPPGKYILKVKACNNDGVWNKKPTTFSFIITPPFWQTLWFYMLCFVTGGSSIYGFYKWRVRNLQRAKKILEHKVKLRTTEVMQQKEEILTQKEELEVQRDELRLSNEELNVLNEEIAQTNDKLVETNEVIEQRNKDITDSINYAKLIQEAILPPVDVVNKVFPQSFILFKPKDIVSGDFYWISNPSPPKSPASWRGDLPTPLPKGKGDGKVPPSGRTMSGGHRASIAGGRGASSFIIAAVDCTGHGVPGAFMSMIGNDLLNEIVNKRKINQPAKILGELNDGIVNALKQTGEGSETKDGMDIAICNIDVVNGHARSIQYAGAYNPLYIIRKNIIHELGDLVHNDKVRTFGDDLCEIRGNNFPIGIDKVGEKDSRGRTKIFTDHTINLKKGDSIYLFQMVLLINLVALKEESFPTNDSKSLSLKSRIFQWNSSVKN
ncbi:MAG: SpoIIE family protein phosphatase [Bacteroidetes bacterium]|nr:SpoIIE family protein phosphatase [Bacteroidota bacterium]